MRISYNWLRDYVDVRMVPEKLGELLTMAGFAVESIENVRGDSILELEVTSNRPDCLSVIGIAREVAALTGRQLTMPPLSTLPITPAALAAGTRTASRIARPVKVTIEDRELCAKYTARVIEGVTVANSPSWLAKKIDAMGLRSVNNIVDITNFCLFEIGEPLHAFDLDKISGLEVIVRRARPGERIVTIDGVERTLDETVLVIADGNKPVAIAGVMGGLNTEVTASTKNILLEAALFNPVSLRRTSRKLGISTESSYRFERKIDPESVLYASSRAARLIVQHAGGVAGDVVERGTKGAPRRPIELVHSRLTATLGVDIPRESVKKALSSLGCRVKGGSKEMLTVEPPSFRNDVESEIDLIEEVARIFGYGKIPVTVPAIPLDYKPRLPLDRLLEERIGSLLAAEGLYEVLTYSLMSRRDLESAHLLDEAVVDIANPLSQEQESMRPSMIPGLLKVIEWNINRKARELGFFEIGALYRKGRPEGTPEGPSGGPHEERHLAIGLSGEVRGNWRSPAREADFFDLKGFLETVFGELGLRGAQFVRGERAMFSAGSSASISVDGTHIGYIGEIAKDVLARFDIKQKVYALELSIDEIAKRWAPHDRYIEPPKYPFVARDLSIVVDKAVENARIVRIIKERGGSIVRDVVLLDRYTGTQIPDGKVGLTYRIEYLDPSKTLEDGEVTSAHAAIYNGLVSEAGAAVR